MYETGIKEILAISSFLILPILVFTFLGKSPEERSKEALLKKNN